MSPVPSDRAASLPLSTLDAADLRRWAFRAESNLKVHRQLIDALNVFPVPDGDTGTNLFMTLHSALGGLVGTYLRQSPDVSVVAGAQALTQHMLLSARGNSGVILSQLLRGLADALAAEPPSEGVIDGPLAARMLRGGAQCARRAVSEPVDGTILTVADAAAEGGERAAARGGSLAKVTGEALEAAVRALANTPGQLPPLARAGVVDAGGAGLVVLLGALHEVVTRVAPGRNGYVDPTRWWVGGVPKPLRGGEPHQSGSGAYEVMYLLEACSDDDADRLRDRLGRLGESVMVVGDRRLRTVHVHLDDAGAAVEAGLGIGRLSAIRITWLAGDSTAAQPTGRSGCRVDTPADPADTSHGTLTDLLADPLAEELIEGFGVDSTDDLPEEAVAAVAAARVGAVACAPGPGLIAGFRDAGAQVVENRPGHRATTGLILAAVTATGSSEVVVLPNDSDALLAAQAAAQLACAQGLAVHVIPTVSPIQGMVALAVLDPAGALPDNLVRMTEAAALVRCGRVAFATRPAHTDVGVCRAGDVLGLIGESVVVLDVEPVEVAMRLLDRLDVADAELVTLVSGQDHPQLGDRVAARISRRWPTAEVTTLIGGQPVDGLLVGVE